MAAIIWKSMIAKTTLYNHCGLSAQKNIARASIAAGIVDIQKQMRHLNTKLYSIIKYMFLH